MSDAPPGDVADDAARRIAWAARGMPVLSSIQEGLTARGALNGLRIGIGLVLEPKTANLALALQHAGAQVSVHCRGRLTTEGVARALEAAGLQVYAERAATQERVASSRPGWTSCWTTVRN